MGKKVGIIILIIIIVALIAGGLYYLFNNNQNRENQSTSITGQSEGAITDSSSSNTNAQDSEENTNITSDNSNILIVYYSATGNTEDVANRLAENLGADIFEITPAQEYTSDDLDWTNSNSRVSREHEDESLRNVELTTTTVDNWSDYDTVLIGYPIWWGIAAWPVDTFVKANDFNGKTVIPFCTSSSSGLGQSGELLEEEANGGNWLEGHRFRGNPSDSDINNFVESIQ